MNKWLIKLQLIFLSFAPVFIGTSMAYGDGIENLPLALLSLCAMMMIYIGTFTPSEMKLEKTIAFLLVLPVWVYLIIKSYLVVTIVIVFLAVMGFHYNLWKRSLECAGLGDLFALIFGFIALIGTYYLQSREINTAVIVAGLAPGLFGVTIFSINNIFNIENDRKRKKRTIAVRLGKNAAYTEFLFAIIAASLMPVLIYGITFDHLPTLLSTAVLIFAIPTIITVMTKTDSISLSNAVASTTKLMLIYSLIFSVGWIF